jgi:arylsulfatase A-like enzyme
MLAIAATAACSRPEYELRRPFEEDDSLAIEYGQIGETTRPFTRIEPTGEAGMTIDLGPVWRGFLRTHLALDPNGRGPATASLELRSEGLLANLMGDKTTHCRHEWPSPAEQKWLECLLPIPRDRQRTELVIRFEATEGTGLRVSSPLLVAAEAAARSDVFLIVADALRADVFKTFNGRVPVGARIDELARQSIVFESLRAPSSWTRTSVATLLTGLSPARHKVFDRLDPLAANVPTLQSQLRANGYVTYAWSTNPNILPVWGFASGFDAFVDAAIPESKGDKPDARDVFANARSTVLATRDEPAFYYIHLMDPHYPYLPPEYDLKRVVSLLQRRPTILPNANLVEASNPDAVFALGEYQRYLAEVRDLDAQIGTFLDFLKKLGLYDDALIFVTSDHGEEFLDHGDLFHGNNLYEESLRVPGILKLPGNELAGTRIDRPTNLADALPTITTRLGVNPPPGVAGSDVLVPEGTEFPHVATLVLDGRRMAAVSYRGWKLIRNYRDGGMELFDLEADPRETNDLAGEQTDKVRELRSLLGRMDTASQAGWHFRGCGCDEAAVVAFGIRAPGAEIRPLDLEEADSASLASDDERFDVVFHLTPTINRQARFGKAIGIAIRDEDELSLGPPAADGDSASGDWILLAPPDDAPNLRLAFGNQPPGILDAPVSLTSVYETARLDVGAPANCGRPLREQEKPMPQRRRTCDAYLRVWYVRTPDSISESAVDPEVSERLKALGYAW